jgi:hypothetical protein
MMHRHATRDCERYRALGSLGLDRGLSMLDQRRLARHRRRCPDCDVTIRAMAEMTRRVRAAAFEPAPAPVVVRAPARVRARLPRPAAAAAFAAVLVVAAALGMVASSPSRRPAHKPSPRTLIVAERRLPNLLAEMPQIRMRSERLPGGRAPTAASRVT